MDTSLLGDWPPVSWKFPLEDCEIRFDRYGRKEDELDKNLRSEVVEGIQGIRYYSVHAAFKESSKPIYLEAGVIDFSIGFTGRQWWTGEEVCDALAPLEFFYANETWTLIEIIN